MIAHTHRHSHTKHTKQLISICQEFLLALDITAGGSPEEKLRWAFKMYDKDNSSEQVDMGEYVDGAEVFAETVELGEMIEMIGILYEMQGVSQVGKK